MFTEKGGIRSHNSLHVHHKFEYDNADYLIKKGWRASFRAKGLLRGIFTLVNRGNTYDILDSDSYTLIIRCRNIFRLSFSSCPRHCSGQSSRETTTIDSEFRRNGFQTAQTQRRAYCCTAFMTLKVAHAADICSAL